MVRGYLPMWTVWQPGEQKCRVPARIEFRKPSIDNQGVIPPHPLDGSALETFARPPFSASGCRTSRANADREFPLMSAQNLSIRNREWVAPAQRRLCAATVNVSST